MDTPRSLADAYMAEREETDHFRHLYMGDLDWIEQWEVVADDGVSRRQERLAEFADRASQMEPADAAERALLDTVAQTATDAVDQLTWRNELTLVNPVMGLPMTVLTFLGRYQLATAAHGEAYHEKLRGMDVLLDDLAASVVDAADHGRIATSAHLLGSSQLWAATADQGTRSALCSQAAPTDLDTTAGEAWSAARDEIVTDAVLPAIRRLSATLADLAPRGRSDEQPGLCHLDGGADLYERKVRSNTTLDVTAAEVHQTGLEQVARLEQEYLELAGPLFGLSTIDEIFTKLRDDPDLRYQSGPDLVRDAEAAIAKATAAAPDWFSTIPRSTCTAEEIENGPLAFYSKPNPAIGKQGVFFFNTSDPSAWATFQLEAVTYHESIPGHHLQLALVAEDDSLHPVNTELILSAHAEGWGLYTERLADEMGLYSSTLDRIGMLAADSMRACRLVVDTGLHALGWSRQQAIDYASANSPLSPALVAAEVDRFIGVPGQAVSYMMGRIEIDRIRAEAEARPGFDIKDFHHELLRHGSVPLPTLRDLVLA